MVKFPCGICQKAVATKHKATCCDLCNKWIHIGCSNLNKSAYIQIQHSDANWFCMPCLKNEVPSNTITDHELEKVNTMVNTYSLKKHKVLQKMQTIFYKMRQIKRFSACMTLSSLPYHFEEFDKLLNSLHIKFNVIGVTESRLKLNVQALVNINLKTYNTDENPTELEKGGVFLYISYDINYKVCKDLNVYEAKELESIFIEIINKNRKIVLLDTYTNTPKC